MDIDELKAISKPAFTSYGWSVIEDKEADADEDSWLILDNDGDVYDTADQRCEAIKMCRTSSAASRVEWLWDEITSVDPYDYGIDQLEKIAKSLNISV